MNLCGIKLISYTFLGAILIAFQIAVTANAQPDRLTIYTEHFPPYNYRHNGEIDGVNVRLVKHLCMEAGIVCKFEIYPWLRAFDNALKDPRGGLVSTSRTQKRENQFKWVGPLFFADSYLYRLGSRPEVKVADLNGVKQYVVGIPRGDVYEEYFLERGFSYDKNLIAFSNKPDGFDMLLKGKIDLIMGSEVVIPYWLSRLGKDRLAVEAVLPLPGVGGNHLALNPEVPQQLVTRLQKQLNSMRSKGELDKLKSEYFAPVPADSGDKK
ncbi:substrate-binding periplasmic protein [Lacimicrobium alkaliphilum]|uniref:Solute-binding protein family 3/N-terminal domain-containing protein n=1 Tax=Lacimicrobium alkaliphilum TaxID=1526571 RepID=A0A0U2Z969_9ALTE|nr:ABC transporter substrate-binding protein [Lacimicrobium alkaliphilum]ALS99475.1 hypothetical protein AT746_15215 [Lacimicrobium alkaliphilum]